MRFHVLAFGKAALVGSAGDVQLVAVPEQPFSQSAAQNFTVPVPLNCVAAYAGGATLSRARFNTGSLRARGFPQIYPLNLQTIPPSPVSVADFRPYPVQFHAQEDLRVDITSGIANDQVALAFVTPEPVNYNINARDLRMLRFTASPTNIAIGWSQPVAIAFQDTLEGGSYDIYGMGVQGSSSIAARLILQGEFYRPGCLVQFLNTGVPHPMFMGQLGKWASFSIYSPPQIETLGASAAAEALNGWLLCSKSMAA